MEKLIVNPDSKQMHTNFCGLILFCDMIWIKLDYWSLSWLERHV